MKQHENPNIWKATSHIKEKKKITVLLILYIPHSIFFTKDIEKYVQLEGNLQLSCFNAYTI